jgi:hypothetical protein
MIVLIIGLTVPVMCYFYNGNGMAKEQIQMFNQNKFNILPKYETLFSSIGFVEGIAMIPINQTDSTSLQVQIYAKTPKAHNYFTLNFTDRKIRLYLKTVTNELLQQYRNDYFLYYKNEGTIGFIFTTTGTYYYCTEEINGKQYIIYLEKDSSNWDLSFNIN